MRRFVVLITALAMAIGLAAVATPAGAEPASAPDGTTRVDARRLALGHGTACVILDNGDARCWGNNNQGQAGAQIVGGPLGRDESPDLIPTVDVGAGRTVVEIDGGAGHTCALLDDATVRCWGGEGNGQLGDPDASGRIGDNESPTTIEPVRFTGTPISIASGNSANCALLDSGDMQCWGTGGQGELGTGATFNIGDDPNEDVNTFPPVDLGAAGTAITLGKDHGCAILADGTIRCWGNAQGLTSTGTGRAVPTANPAFLLGGKRATAISAGDRSTCAIDEDQDVWCWGVGQPARWSAGANASLPDPTKVDLGTRKIIALDLGFEHACVVDTAGAVLCWGDAGQGRLGYGNTDDIGDDEPPTTGGSVDIGSRTAKAVSAGQRATCVLLDNDTVRCWGDADEIGSGQPLDIGDTELPTAIPPINVVGTAAFTPVPTPARVLETRPEFAGPTPVGLGKGPVTPGTSVDVQITGVGGVPATDVYAVVLNVTVVNPTGPGFITAFAAGTARPTASNINVNGAGEVAPNSVIVPLSPDGRISLFSLSGGHLVADVFGYFEPTASASAGRFIGVSPSRVFDTRPEFPPAGNKGALGGGDTIEIQITGANGVPASGVSAVVLNVTGTNAAGPGFVTVFPGDVTRPNTSNLNLVSAGATRPNTVIVPVSATGTVKFFSLSGVDLIADVTGYFTDDTAPDTDDGLFVRLDPARLLDTRITGPSPVADGGTTDFDVTGRLGIPSTANAAVFNFTATNASSPGFVTAFPADASRPGTSSLNIPVPGEAIANLGIIPLTQPSGAISLFTLRSADLIADTSGYFL